MSVGTVQIQNVVITRSRRGNIELSRRLREHGFNPISVDTISFLPPEDWSPIDKGLRDLASYDWLVFTSTTGVEFFARRMKKLRVQLPWSGKPSVAAIGESTARALSELSMTASFIPSSYLTEKLADELPSTLGRRVLLLRADIADPAVSERLRRRGFEAHELSIYRTKYSENGGGERVEDADLVVFASPSAVKGFCRKIPESKLETLKEVRTVCIGPVTGRAAREYGFKQITLPKSHTLDSLVEEIVRLNHDA